MDVVYFLKERTSFIRHLYDAGLQPFEDRKRKIEDHEPPFHEPQYGEDPEPPFLNEWVEADTAINVLGLACLSLLSDSLKLYLQTLQTRVIRFVLTDEEKSFFKRRGLVAGYKAVLTEILDTDWADCPADFAILEQVVLARNRGQHGEHLTSLLVNHDRPMLDKHPRPFFVREQERQAWEEGYDPTSSFLSPNIVVTRDSLVEAIRHVELLADWIDARMDRAEAWRSRQV